MQYARQEQEKCRPLAPRIIIHGGAGNITRENLNEASYQQYRHALLSILQRAEEKLQKPHATALDVAVYAVSLLEEDPLFNAGHGAVYTRDGTHELEASVMVSRGSVKRGVGVMQVRHVRSPISLARELLVCGEGENGGGAQGHCQLTGDTCDRLAREWGLEMVKPSYFWTRKRWDEHRRGLGLNTRDSTYEKHRRAADRGESRSTQSDIEATADAHAMQDPGWDGKEYLPQGTVGTVVLDSDGTLCVCTSTGGLTNKLSGRIGDTPTIGAGFWAEQWYENGHQPLSTPSTVSWLADCLPSLTGYSVLPTDAHDESTHAPKRRAAAISGTGNGDSFLRINAVRTAAAITRYAGVATLQSAVTAVAGPHGQLQQSAGDRWHKTGEGEGGMIGIELKDERGVIVYDHNCGGMFRAWIDDNGGPRFGVFQDEKDIQS